MSRASTKSGPIAAPAIAALVMIARTDGRGIFVEEMGKLVDVAHGVGRVLAGDHHDPPVAGL